MKLVFTKASLLGVVEEILEGLYKIRGKDDEVMRVELANVYCPIANEPGAYECREFARKSLLGKEINIFPKKDSKFNTEATVVRTSDNKDIETLLIEHGYGFIKE